MAPQHFVFQTLRRIGYPLFKPKLSEVSGIEHLPKTGGFMLAANHVDWLDGFYIAAAVGLKRNIPVNFLTSSNNYWWTTVAIQIPTNRRGDIVDIAVKALKGGKVICNFIEGQRNTEAKLMAGKTGTVRIAAAAGVPVIPLGITCSSGRTMAQSVRYLMSKNHQVKIKIGAALEFHKPDGGHSKDWLNTETARLMRAIAPLAGKSV